MTARGAKITLGKKQIMGCEHKQSSVFAAEPLPYPLGPFYAPILPPDLLCCQRDKARDSGRALKRASDAGFSRPRPQVLHLASCQAPPSPPACYLGAQRPPEESKLAALGTACSVFSVHVDCCRVWQSQGARVLRSLQKLLAWEGRESSGMPLSTTSSTRACRAPPIPAGLRELGREADQRCSPCGTARSQGSGVLVLTRDSDLPAALWAACTLVLDSMQLLLLPHTSPHPSRGPETSFLWEKGLELKLRCRRQSWGHWAIVFNSIGL